MEPKTIRELVDYIGIFGTRTVARIKEKGEVYRSCTFDEYKKNSKYIAAYLYKKKHLRKGDMAAVYSENRPEWMMSYFGIVYNGLWAVPLDARLTDLEVKNLILDSGAEIIFLSKTLYDNINSSPEIIRHVKEFIIFDDPGNGMAYTRKIKKLSDVISEGREYAEDMPSVDVSPDDIASLIYTSGTMGNPKGVLLSHGNFAHQFYAIPKALPLSQTDTLLSVLPLHHTFEFSCELGVMYIGIPVTYAESLKPNKLLANIKETNVTFMAGVPLLFEKIYEGIMRQVRNLPFGIREVIMGLYYITSGLNKFTNNQTGKTVFKFLRKKASLANIRFIVSGAAPLNFKVAKGFETLGLTILNGYGLTEASPIVSVNRVEKKIKNDSVGIPVPGVEVRIDSADELGNGEIYVRGPNVMQGYYNNKKVNRDSIDEKGWMATGDIGKLDSEGYLYITGRKKSIIVTPGGKNVYPEEIEEMLNSSPYVLESLVLGIPVSENDKSENIYALIVPDYEYLDAYAGMNSVRITDELVEGLIVKHVREVSGRLADYKKIKGWRIRTEEFPKTSTRKIKRFLFSGRDFLNS